MQMMIAMKRLLSIKADKVALLSAFAWQVKVLNFKAIQSNDS
jgi:hypothetical protein